MNLKEMCEKIATMNPVQRFPAPAGTAAARGDQRDGRLYVYTDEIKTAVRVALATDRPLLILGSPGCGKSSLAANLARVLDLAYYETVVTSRTRARDLLWQVDAVARLSDAQARQGAFHEVAPCLNGERLYHRYITPGVLWWILARDSAERRGLDEEIFNALEPKHQKFFRAQDPGECNRNNGAVLLVDEIDKAEPDFGNDLLVPIGSYRFRVEDLGVDIEHKGLDDLFLVVITSNRERELPAAFVRRCIVLEMSEPIKETLFQIARETLEDDIEKHLEGLYSILEPLGEPNPNLGDPELKSATLSIPEFLDSLRAALQFEANNEDTYREIIEHTVWKRGRG